MNERTALIFLVFVLKSIQIQIKIKILQNYLMIFWVNFRIVGMVLGYEIYMKGQFEMRHEDTYTPSYSEISFEEEKDTPRLEIFCTRQMSNPKLSSQWEAPIYFSYLKAVLAIRKFFQFFFCVFVFIKQIFQHFLFILKHVCIL